MTYATQQELADTLGGAELAQLTDRDLDGSADTAVVTRILADVDGLIDGYVSVRYEMPLSSTPALVRMLAIDLAHERLYPHGAPAAVERRAERAIATLKEIAAGTVKLDATEATA